MLPAVQPESPDAWSRDNERDAAIVPRESLGVVALFGRGAERWAARAIRPEVGRQPEPRTERQTVLSQLERITGSRRAAEHTLEMTEHSLSRPEEVLAPSPEKLLQPTATMRQSLAKAAGIRLVSVAGDDASVNIGDASEPASMDIGSLSLRSVRQFIATPSTHRDVAFLLLWVVVAVFVAIIGLFSR